jgi:hypothetical protein
MITSKFVDAGSFVLYSAVIAAYCMLVFSLYYKFLGWIFRDQAL